MPKKTFKAEEFEAAVFDAVMRTQLQRQRDIGFHGKSIPELLEEIRAARERIGLPSPPPAMNE